MNELTLTNPAYVQMLKLGKRVFWVPKTVTLSLMSSEQLEATNKTTIELYPDQVEVFDQVKPYTSGLLEAQTGSGKTVIAIALHQAWGGRTLVVCHSLILAKQFAEEFNKFIGIKPTFYCDGKHDQTGEVVVTTLTSFRKEYENFKDFKNLIVDEADLAFTIKTMKAILNFKAVRKWAFTGTTESVYDDCNKLHAPVLAKFWDRHIIHKSTREIPLKGVLYFEYIKTYPKVFPHKDWLKFREILDADLERKKAQLDFILENTDPKGSSLFLWDRVADVEAFYRALKSRGCPVYMSTGEMSKKDREQHLIDFKKTGGYLVGVSSTLNRGYDNTLLTKAFILHPIKGENTIRQSVGRILRHFEGKESYLYLWSDSMLGFQLNTQKKILEKFFGVPMVSLNKCSKQNLALDFNIGGTIKRMENI